MNRTETEAHADALITLLTQVLSEYQFELWKWVSNNVYVFKQSVLNEMEQYQITDYDAKKSSGCGGIRI